MLMPEAGDKVFVPHSNGGSGACCWSVQRSPASCDCCVTWSAERMKAAEVKHL
jgi:hypothetical protein